MKDPYQEVFEEIGTAFRNTNKAIIELAKRTLTVNEFEEFIKTASYKQNEEEEDEPSEQSFSGR